MCILVGRYPWLSTDFKEIQISKMTQNHRMFFTHSAVFTDYLPWVKCFAQINSVLNMPCFVSLCVSTLVTYMYVDYPSERKIGIGGKNRRAPASWDADESDTTSTEPRLGIKEVNPVMFTADSWLVTLLLCVIEQALLCTQVPANR